MNNETNVKTLDKDWIQLISQAKSMGLDVNEIREFLKAFQLDKAQ